MRDVVLLDSEAVQALRAEHGKHRHMVALLLRVAGQKQRKAESDVLVPTAVRVEAGWDRTQPGWAGVNRFGVGDVELSARLANLAARIRADASVGLADAHLGATIRTSPAERVTVITSDPSDIFRAAGDRRVNVIAL